MTSNASNPTETDLAAIAACREGTWPTAAELYPGVIHDVRGIGATGRGRAGRDPRHRGDARLRGLTCEGGEAMEAGTYTITISPEDKQALDRAVNFARRVAGDDTPRTPESDGRWIMDIVRCWHRERRDAALARGF